MHLMVNNRSEIIENKLRGCVFLYFLLLESNPMGPYPNHFSNPAGHPALGSYPARPYSNPFS